VEAWVWSASWADVTEACTLDDGDTARLLCRVADLLRQIYMADAVEDSLRTTARVAYDRLYRQPIRDLLNT
jgi:superfamily II RNA helicase